MSKGAKSEVWALNALTIVKGEVKVPFKPSKPYFSYTGPKLFNFLPEEMRKTTSPMSFKAQLKQWIWENIPSV